MKTLPVTGYNPMIGSFFSSIPEVDYASISVPSLKVTVIPASSVTVT